jgi:voltage-gated sodium channel
MSRRMAGSGMTRRLRGIVESTAFTALVIGVILANAAVLGAQTYPVVVDRYGALLERLDSAFLAFFVVELALRMTAHGRRPRDFFRSGWNVFDFVVVAAAFVPVLNQNSTLLRLARLARVVRVIRLLPDLRVLVLAMARSVPPLVSMSVLTAVILYVYAILGWSLFGAEDPGRWGDVGTAMLSLFVMLSLETLPANLEAGMAIHPWSWIYFVSFALIAAFIILNVLIGVVLNSLEEARKIEAERIERAAKLAERGDRAEVEAVDHVAERVMDLRQAAEELERELHAMAEHAAGRSP